jgi:hypothetical protein
MQIRLIISFSSITRPFVREVQECILLNQLAGLKHRALGTSPQKQHSNAVKFL